MKKKKGRQTLNIGEKRIKEEQKNCKRKSIKKKNERGIIEMQIKAKKCLK